MSLLGVVAFAQLGAVIWRVTAFSPLAAVPAIKTEEGPASTVSPPIPAIPQPAQADAETHGHITNAEPGTETDAETQAAQLLAQERQIALEAAEQQLLSHLPQPTPVPVRQTVTPQSRVNGLVQLARALRDRGDTSTALTRLREAQVILPNHALIISEMALTYERMQLTDKAIEQWRRIYEFGEKAGIYYTAAEAKLRAFQLPDTEPHYQPALGLDGRPLDSSTPLLSLGEVATTHDTHNSETLRRLRLRVPILAQPGSHIDVQDVVIQVFFYDRISDGSLVETNADVQSAWANRVTEEGDAMIDWTTPEPEVLEVDYHQIESETLTERGRERRNYFGYVVRVYYKGTLNATHAEPALLLNQFPPPQILQANDLPQ